MKFEMPVAEIRRFDLNDVLSASGEIDWGTGPWTDRTNQEDSLIGIYDDPTYSCIGTHQDDDPDDKYCV